MKRHPLLILSVFYLVTLTVPGVGASAARADEPSIIQLTGPTMGTAYSVKLYEPKSLDRSLDDLRIGVDALLRQINDQMSTYLEQSEISRFNHSDSTDWFPVSKATTEVVAYAQDVAEKTDGALDVTVGPLVDLWSFGPEPRSRQVPDQQELEQALSTTGYDKLQVRTEPPALKKSVKSLRIDLSAVAKGYAVDRVVEFLNDAGAKDVFVEIGGEVRVSGNKDGQWWKVGIQVPDTRRDQVMIAYSLNTGSGDDRAMATSGDYRNYFEQDGVRYSHTIDPTTGRPITHSLASVSIVSESCLAADAWATAINVLGPERGLDVAERENLNALLIERENDGFQRSGTGALASYAKDEAGLAADGQETKPDRADVGDRQWFAVLMITVVAFALALFAMAVGVMFGRRAISGSCGGLSGNRNEDGSVSCSLCSNPDNACKDLKRRMQQQAGS